MRSLGFFGGFSSEASATCVRLLHEEVRRRRGGFHSAPLQTFQFDRDEVTRLCSVGDWARLGSRVETAARGLAAAGAEALLCELGPLHAALGYMQTIVGVPLLHGIDICGAKLKAEGIRCAGLLGTRFFMEEKEWIERLNALGVDVVLPARPDRDTIIKILDTELADSVIREESYVTMIRTMKALKRQGAEVIVMVAPELSLLVHPEDISLPLRDAAQWHTQAAIKWALGL